MCSDPEMTYVKKSDQVGNMRLHLQHAHTLDCVHMLILLLHELPAPHGAELDSLLPLHHGMQLYPDQALTTVAHTPRI